MTTTDTTTPTSLTTEELQALGTLLDRVQTRGIREAQTLIHLVTKLQRMGVEAKAS